MFFLARTPVPVALEGLGSGNYSQRLRQSTTCYLVIHYTNFFTRTI